MDTTDKPSWQTVNDAAALWYAQLDSGTADEAAFEAWRAADPLHAAAFARIAAASLELDQLSGGDYSHDRDLKPSKHLNRRRLLQWGALGVSLVGASSVWAVARSRAYAETVVGGRQTVTLPDGGRLDLNTDTRASWKFDHAVRKIWLERGEIALDVVADKRPLLVITDRSTVTIARGMLNARLRSTSVDLTMLKGEARILVPRSHTNAAAEVPVVAGEGAILGQGMPRVRNISMTDQQFTSGWRQDQIILEGQTLSTAIEEYNRYLKAKIVIADPELSGLRLGGRFNTHDPKDFLASLQSSFGVHATEGFAGSIVLTR